MKITLDASQETSATVTFQGITVDVTVENVPEDRTWKVDNLRRERDEERAYAARLRKTIDEMGIRVRELTSRTAVRNKIQAIKKVREITGWGLKESLDLVTAVLAAVDTP